MKINWRWWIGFTIVTALVIFTITTFVVYGYVNKFFSYCIIASIFYIYIANATGQHGLYKTQKILNIIALTIFCSSNFIVVNSNRIFLISHEKDKPPTVMTEVFAIKLPYTYDITLFYKTQRLTIRQSNKTATIKFELSDNKQNLLMLDHAFSGQEEFHQRIQELSDVKFFDMNTEQRNEYLEIFEFYGLTKKITTIRIYYTNIEK